MALVYAAKFSGLVKDGNAARVVNVILAVVFGGYKFGDDAAAGMMAYRCRFCKAWHVGHQAKLSR